MQITVNGETREIEPQASISALLGDLNLASKACAVELNRVVVPHTDHDSKTLKPGDQLEIVTLVGGG